MRLYVLFNKWITKIERLDHIRLLYSWIEIPWITKSSLEVDSCTTRQLKKFITWVFPYKKVNSFLNLHVGYQLIEVLYKKRNKKIV